ncbi:hypothetical protein VM94_00210 [Janthinobacterium sp. KBS0711]|uniref:DUF4440 domain-containing protein n=1 Tax=unclassified Janthinobacterium TaxID=2610881 RepID=UPI000627CBEC|nr:MULTISPECIES: DUF4440 domain-containing protein [unclassified Janthinobacterium]KKO65872.1 hypothetical protein VM94_00210 [Janthinobacterium sp. KBS0711]TSD69772.1 DUF4440 domain-containing protein [Janthinobacterium sp. KBS0711]
MTATNPYFDDVLSTHVLIRAWLSGEAAAENCAQLLARFSPDFTMVAPGGMRLDHFGLTGFFQGAGGSRPGLAMRITDLQLIQESATGATVSYREFQSLPGAENTERWSTVVYEKTPDGALLWRHLHETWAARAD